MNICARFFVAGVGVSDEDGFVVVVCVGFDVGEVVEAMIDRYG